MYELFHRCTVNTYNSCLCATHRQENKGLADFILHFTLHIEWFILVVYFFVIYFPGV